VSLVSGHRITDIVKRRFVRPLGWTHGSRAELARRASCPDRCDGEGLRYLRHPARPAGSFGIRSRADAPSPAVIAADVG